MTRRYNFLTIGVTLLFLMLGLWKFGEVLSKPGVCLTNSGDGIGGIGNVFSVKQAVSDEGIQTLLSDTFSSRKTGFGLSVPGPISIIWKVNYCVLSNFFSPENVYDVNALIAFVLIGIFSFLLLIELGVSPFLSLIGAILTTHMDCFFSRLNGHVFGLATFYIPLILCWAAVRAGKRPSIGRLLAFAGFSALNFQMNEYYGYYGIFFSCSLVLGYYFLTGRKVAIRVNRLVCGVTLSALFFIILMCLFYPTLVFPKFMAFLSKSNLSGSAIAVNANPWYDFLYFSVRKPLALFESYLPFMRDTALHGLFKNDLGEFTFRIGVGLPVVIIVGFIFVSWNYLFLRQSEARYTFWECSIWFCSALLMVLFSLNPDKFVSLVPFTYKIAPMFRVAARAFLYVDLAIIVLSLLVINRAFYFIKMSFPEKGIINKIVSISFMLFLALVFLLGAVDLTRDRLLRRVNALELPRTEIYDKLRKMPEGLVLELPMCSPVTQNPECNYEYYYNRSVHGFPMVNASYPLPSNVKYRYRLDEMSQYINSLSQEAIADLKKGGVKYIVVNKLKINDSSLRTSDDLRLVADQGNKSLFEMREGGDFNKDGFLEKFLFSVPSFTFLPDFHNPEKSEKGYWIWSGRNSKMVLENKSKNSKKVRFSATFFSAKKSTLKIVSSILKDVIKFETPYIEYERELFFEPGEVVVVTFISDAPEYLHPNSNLVFCMYNYKFR